MKQAEVYEKIDSLLIPGEWIELNIEDADLFMKRRFYCGDCGDWNTYGKTPFCPYCGKKKVNAYADMA